MSTQEHIQAIRDHLNKLEAELFVSFEIKQVSDTAVQVNFSEIENPEILYSKSTARTFKLSDYKEVRSGVEIGGLDEGKWYFQLLDGKTVIDEKPFTLESQSDETDKPEIKNMIWGWWYGEKHFSNTIKVWANDIPEALDTEYKVIPFLGNPGLDGDSPLSDWKKRLENKGRHLKNVSREKVPVVIIADEPDHISVSRLEEVIELAKQVINPDLSYTFSFRRTHIDPDRTAVPQNTDIIWWNHYPFRGKDYPNPYSHVVTEQNFYKEFQETLDIARELAPNAKFYITSQAFAQRTKDDRYWQFRPPVSEAPLWYARFISRNDDLLGALHFAYERDRGLGAVEMPELLKNIEKAYNEMD